MKKSLTTQQFNAAVRLLDVTAQTLEIARGVLVDGVPQSAFVTKFGITKGAVSQAVNRVWEAYIPEGHERITVILPKDKAKLVKTWAAEVKKSGDS